MHDAYNFKKPGTPLLSTCAVPEEHDERNYECFEDPGPYEGKGEGERYSRLYMERFASRFESYSGTTDARGLAVGHTFSLTDHSRADQNRVYLVTQANLLINLASYNGSKSTKMGFGCTFSAMDLTLQFRPEPITPRPIIRGIQTAKVVGKKGEEIDTDAFGRINVQFHRDRYAKGDETSSCWIRTATPWAGKKWGLVGFPRIGQEVVVTFEEGDPGRPLVTGMVYNAINQPPYALPANKTQTGIKSRSTKSGGVENFNEIRFEYKKGEEHVYVHAEKELSTAPAL